MEETKKESRTAAEKRTRTHGAGVSAEAAPDAEEFFSRASIAPESVSEYENNLIQLVRKVDKLLTKKNAEHNLIGDNSLSVMYDNHENHAHFILNVLQLNDWELLRNTLPWVLHSYTARGFSPRYFREVLSAYKAAMHSVLSGKAAEEISALYDWMADLLPLIERQNEALRQQPEQTQEEQTQMPADHYADIVQAFTGYLLDGDYRSAHAVVSQELATISIQDVYLNIIQPAMYRVGDLWEEGSISVAHEHLATSIVMRLISYFYPEYVVRDPIKGSVIVTASVNEYHEVGARIVADLLEIDGWDVFYLGADTPPQDLLTLVKEHKVFAVCISVTMSFNLNKVRELIRLIRESSGEPSGESAGEPAVKILVGGNAFRYSSHLKEEIDADACGSSALESLVILDRWHSGQETE